MHVHFREWKCMISLMISLKFVPRVRINNIPALVPIMAWRRSGDKPLSKLMMVRLLTHICVTRPQWVKISGNALGPSDAHICVSTLTMIGPDNGLSPDRRQAIIWTNAGILLIGPMGTNFSEILEIHIFSFRIDLLSGPKGNSVARSLSGQFFNRTVFKENWSPV